MKFLNLSIDSLKLLLIFATGYGFLKIDLGNFGISLAHFLGTAIVILLMFVIESNRRDFWVWTLAIGGELKS